MNMDNIVLSLRKGCSQYTKEAFQGIIAVEQGYLIWRRNIRFEIGTNGDIALVHQWQTMLVILTISRLLCQYDMQNA
jgi:hypothetical protein